MKKLAIAFATLTTISGVAYSSDFAGFNAQISAGYQNAQNQIDGASNCGQTGNGCYTDKTNSGDFITRVGVGYTFDVMQNYTLGIEAEYNPLKNKGGSFGVYDSTNTLLPNSGSTFSNKNQFMISIEPGYVVSKDLLAYGKIGYGQSQLSIDNSSGISSTLNGVNFGLGAKYLYNKNIFGFAEVNYIPYSDKRDNVGGTTTANFKVTTYDFSIGIGYQF